MAFNGSGVFQRLYNWTNDKAASIKIRADRMDNEMNGFATGLSTCLTKDGQTTVTANLPMAGFKHTGVGDSTALNQYAVTEQVQNNSFNWCGTATGTADAFLLSPSIAITSYEAGQSFRFIAVGTNTTTTPTVNISGTGAKTVKVDGGGVPVGGIVSGKMYDITYDGTDFQIFAVNIKSDNVSDSLFRISDDSDNTKKLAFEASSIPTGTTVTLTAPSTSGTMATTSFANTAGQQKFPVSASVATNALTVSIDACAIDFRSATLTSGTITRRSVTSTISVVVPSGATLGTVNSVSSRIAVIALDNAGTVEVAVCNLSGGVNLDETGVISTTIMNTSSDSANVVYSTTSRTNVAYRVVGFIDISEATAGTWASAPTLVCGAGGESISAMSSIGYGQTWQAVTRTSGTTYYNTTGKPILVNRHAPANTSGATYSTVSINGGTGFIFAYQYSSVGGNDAVGSVLIPVGASYVFTDTNSNPATLVTTELR